MIIRWREENSTFAKAIEACAESTPFWKKLQNFLEDTDLDKQINKVHPACVKASLKRQVQNKGYTCKNGKPMPFDNMGDKTPCINEDVFSYINFATNQALECLSPDEMPLDSEFITKKINNETTFKFFLAYSGGVGMGQLTSDPVKEVAGWSEKTKKGRVIEHKGQANYLLKELEKSDKASCQVFKKVLAKDFETPPPLPGRPANYCHWLSTGNGLTRNLFYSMAYYRWVRDQIIRPELRKVAPQLEKDRDVLNAFSLVAYGPGGLSQGQALIKRLRLNKNSNKLKVINQIKRNSDYVNQTYEKLEELDRFLPEGVESCRI